MFKGFLIFLWQWLRLLVQALFFLFSGKAVNPLRYSLLIVLGLPVLLVLQLINWFGFLLDEILFSGYRKVKIAKPLFVLGVPRSGTTFLQRTLAKDHQLTTTELWECVFAPSISQRYFWHYFSIVLVPFRVLIQLVMKRFNQKMDAIHTLGLNEAEEDFLLLLPILHSFIQMVLFPGLKVSWELAFIDRDFSKSRRDFVIDFYQLMIRKHLYFHGQEKIYLTKNPSFTSLLEGLTERFPDAIFVACARAPEFTVASQFGSLKPAFDLLGHDLDDQEFRSRVHEMLSYYYRHIEMVSADQRNVYTVTMDQLRGRLFDSIATIYRQCNWEMNESLKQQYVALSEKNKSFKSNHQYSRSDAGQELNMLFEGVWPLSEQGALLPSDRDHVDV